MEDNRFRRERFMSCERNGRSSAGEWEVMGRGRRGGKV